MTNGSERRTVLVTGATDGIGLGTATEFANRGWRVLLHGRDTDKLEKTQQAIAEQTRNDRLETYVADFAHLGEVAALSEQITERHDRLDTGAAI